MENWRTIIGFEGYEVSNHGRVRAKQRIVEYKDGRKGIFSERIMKPMLTHKGYHKVHLSSNKVEGYRTSKQVHRLVAENFIPNPENKPQVNHKDGNKLNNHVSNLEWVTNEENHQHKLDNDLYPSTHTPKKIQQLDIDGKFLAEYDSLYKAAQSIKTDKKPSKIGWQLSRCAKGERKSAFGFLWRFV